MDFKQALSELNHNLAKQGASVDQIAETDAQIASSAATISAERHFSPEKAEEFSTALAQMENFGITHKKEIDEISKEDRGNLQKFCQDMINMQKQDPEMMSNPYYQRTLNAPDVVQQCVETLKNQSDKLDVPGDIYYSPSR